MSREILARGLMSLMLLFVFGSEFVMRKDDDEHDEKKKTRVAMIASAEASMRKQKLPTVDLVGGA